jgi:hypothetical protein
MMSWLTDKRFLVGVAVGYFAVPMIAKHVRAQVERLRPATAPTTAA